MFLAFCCGTHHHQFQKMMSGALCRLPHPTIPNHPHLKMTKLLSRYPVTGRKRKHEYELNFMSLKNNITSPPPSSAYSHSDFCFTNFTFSTKSSAISLEEKFKD